MELISKECVPAIAAEVDIGSKRKRGSVTSEPLQYALYFELRPGSQSVTVQNCP